MAVYTITGLPSKDICVSRLFLCCEELRVGVKSPSIPILKWCRAQSVGCARKICQIFSVSEKQHIFAVAFDFFGAPGAPWKHLIGGGT